MKKRRIALIMAGILSLAGFMTCCAEYTDPDTVLAVQQALNGAGYDCGTPDGKIGNMTRGAISAYQEAAGLAVTGTIEDELLSAMGLMDASGTSGQEAATAELLPVNNEAAWDQLFLYLSENGQDIDGMKGIQKIGEDHTTYIAVADGDAENIYFTTKADRGVLRNSLTFAVKKNDGNAEFRVDDNMNSEGYDDIDINMDTHTYGHVDISTLTSQTLFSAESCERETKDINGNVTNSSDLSNFIPDGSPRQSMYELLTDIPDVLSAHGLDITMNDLGFYTNLDQVYNIELGENETVLNIANDVYCVVPDDWTKKTGDNGIINYFPPENTDQIMTNAIIILPSEVSSAGGLGAFSRGEQREPFLKSSLDAFRKDGFTMTGEQEGIDIAGFQGRSAQVVWHESIGDSDMNIVSFLLDGYRLNDYIVMIGYKVARENETDHSDVYQRILDTIYVDTDGSYTAKLTGSADEAAAPSEESSQSVEEDEAPDAVSDLQNALGALEDASAGEEGEEAGDQASAQPAVDPNAVPATVTQTETTAEIVYDQPVVILDDEMVTISIEGVKFDGEKAWYYYTVKNNSPDKYIREFFQSEAFGDYMLNYSSYTPEGSSGAVPPGKNSGRRGKGTEDAGHAHSLADLQTFSGAIKIYPSDNPDSYGSEDSYIADFSITADLGEFADEQETEAEAAEEGVEVNETDEYAEIIYHTPAVLLDDENVKVVLDSVKLVYGDKIWFWYSLENKGDRYVREFFDGISFGDYMVDYSSYTSEGSSDSVPAGKNSGQRGKGSSDISNVSSLEDLKNFSGSVKLYFGDDADGYSSDGSYSVPFEVRYDELAGTDEQAAESGTEAQAPADEPDAAAAGEGEADSSVTTEELDAMLQGEWGLEGGEESFVFADGSIQLMINGQPLSGPYTFITDQNQIDGTFTVENKNVTIHLPYTYENGVFTLYNNRGAALEKRSSGVGSDGSEAVYTDTDTVKKVQTALNEAGYNCGTPDGMAGPKTFEALHQYQEANGLPVQDQITDALLESMNIQ